MSETPPKNEKDDDSASEAESAGESSAASMSEDESVQSDDEKAPAARRGSTDGPILASDPANAGFFAGGNVSRLSDNDMTIDANEYDKAMGDELPVVSKTLDYDEAKALWKESAVTDNNGEYIPFWSSRKRFLGDIEMLGPGMGLYFRMLRNFALYFFLMSIPVGCVIAHYMYLYYNPDSDLDDESMDALARVTTGVTASTSQDDTIGGWDVRDVMLAVVSLDSLSMLCFLIMVAHLKRKQDEYVEKNDDAVTSLPDYAVQVWGIPTDTTEAEVKEHFSKYGEIWDCVVVKDIGKVMGARITRAKLINTLITMKIQCSGRVNKGYKIESQQKSIAKQKEKILKQTKKIDEKLNEGFTSVCAFITFNNPESRAACVDDYASPGWSCCPKEELKLRGKHMVKVKAAPESSDIIWENVLRPNFATKALRKATSMLMIFILLIAAIGVIVYAKDTLSKSPPAVACPNTVKDATTNPDPMLECKAIWDLAAEDAINNATSEARRSVDMFINNIVSYEDCGDFIVKADWARPMDPSAYGSYNTPATGSTWDGGFLSKSQADECAALTCKQCYCTTVVSLSNLGELMNAYFDSGAAEKAFCKPIFDQIFQEASVMIGTIAMTTITNMVLMNSAAFFSEFERHKTLSATEAMAATYTFGALIVNQMVVPIIIYSFIEFLEGFPVLFQGTFGDFEAEWYNKVMVMILGTAVTNIIAFPVGAAAPNIVAWIKRKLTGCMAHSQKVLNEMYQPADFSLAKRYGQALCALYYTIILSSCAPPLLVAAFFLFIIIFYVDKMILLKFSKRPPMYDHKLNEMFLNMAPYAAWFHLAIATWAFGYYEIPSYTIGLPSIAGTGMDAGAMNQDANADDSNVDYTGAPAQFDFMARIKRLNALVPFLFFVVVTVSLFLANLVNTLLKPICSAMFGHKGPEKVDEVPPFDQLIMPGQVGYEDPVPEGALNNKLSGLRSYRIEDNPKYAKLFPEVIGGDQGKTPTKAPKTQNMA